MASDPETTSLVYVGSAAVTGYTFPSWEIVSVGTPQPRPAIAGVEQQRPQHWGDPLALKITKMPELRSPLSLCSSPSVRLPFKHSSPIYRKLSCCWTCQLQWQQEPVLQIFLVMF